jgi:hypothetical protein
LGWNTVSLTLPLCPGSLYMRLRVEAFQMYTQRSALPAVTCGGSVWHGWLGGWVQQGRYGKMRVGGLGAGAEAGKADVSR